MARRVTTIFNTAITQYVSNAAAAGIVIDPTKWSKYNYQKLIFWTMAFCQSLLEQIMDSFKVDVEATVSVLAPPTPAWLQDQLLNVFEYDPIAVPIAQLDVTTNFIPYYPNPNPAFRVVKYAAVQRGALGTTKILIAGSDGINPVPLDTATVAAALTFTETIGVSGIYYSTLSLDADRLFMQLDVYFNGLYSAVMQTNVIAAINDYMQTQTDPSQNRIPFSGALVLSDLEKAIKAVPGVIDCVFINVQARAFATTFGLGTNLVLNSTLTQRNYPTQAGYIQLEDTPDFTLYDLRAGSSTIYNLNLIPQ